MLFNPWVWKMAWRDSRKSRNRLLLFTSSIVLGIAALVAINSFGDNLREDIDNQAKELLGADLVINSNQPVSTAALAVLDSLGGERATECSFASMILFPKTGGTRLVQVRALEGGFPFYGKIEASPANASQAFRQGKKVLLDQTLMLQFDARRGDSVKIGEVTFVVEGQLIKVPGQAGIAATVAPSVYIPMAYLAQTGLVQKGSRIVYKFYYRFNNGKSVDDLIAAIKPLLDKEGLTYETAETRKASIGRSFENVSRFLNLVAFVALLLGCVGVASAVHIYIREKLATVAVLRCLGVKGSQAFSIYLVQIFVMGLLGSIVGAAIGSGIQTLLPQVFGEFLPLEVSPRLSWPSIGQGVLIGCSIAVLFALLPLLTVRNISPLRTLRTSYEEDASARDPLRWLVYLLILGFIFAFAYFQIKQWKEAAGFTVAVMISFALLAGISLLIMWLTRRFFPAGWSYVWRQSLANLYRPNNQTMILIISIGLGTALITTLYFVQNLLIGQVALSGSGNQPNMVLFDIQPGQREEVAALTRKFNLPVIQQVPIITMRLEGINGRSREELQKDSLNKIPEWALTREYRVTYRDSLISSETLTQGTFLQEVKSPGDTIFVSVDENYAKNMHIKMGDRLDFNVQGAVIPTVVGSLRKIEWNRVQTNFLVVFPKGVLEEAPQFHVIVTRVPSNESSARFQQAIVKNFPNVSVVDLALILSTVDEILNKVSFVIRFMALFSIITGLLVLVGSVLVSKFQRIQESVLLRTLGANRKQILMITALEYFFLGSIASLSGIILALLGSWALAYFTFKSSFMPNVVPMLAVYVAITGLSVVIGLINSRSILNKPPLEVLRSEV